jgi:adenylyltransferase/sulfurtransferase
MTFRTLKLRKNPDCPMCGTHEIKELIDYDQFCGIEKPKAVGPLEVAQHAAVGDATMQDGIPQVSVETLKAKRDAGEDFLLLDVREPHEYQIAQIGGKLIPLGVVGQRLSEIVDYKDKEILVHCRSGARSQKAALELKAAGFEHVANVAGGILAWADRIDPSVAKY